MDDDRMVLAEIDRLFPSETGQFVLACVEGLGHRRLERELLQPLRRAETARFRRFDWSARAMDGTVEGPPSGVVLVEVVYLLRHYLRPYWDFAVYVDAP